MSLDEMASCGIEILLVAISSKVSGNKPLEADISSLSVDQILLSKLLI